MQTVVLEIANAETGDDGDIDGRTNRIYSPSAHVSSLNMVNAQSYKRKAWGIDKDVDGGSHGIVGGSETIAHLCEELGCHTYNACKHKPARTLIAWANPFRLHASD